MWEFGLDWGIEALRFWLRGVEGWRVGLVLVRWVIV